MGALPSSMPHCGVARTWAAKCRIAAQENSLCARRALAGDAIGCECHINNVPRSGAAKCPYLPVSQRRYAASTDVCGRIR